ncbi:unnamed protein product [Lupinus luteus]|uniref:Uncharacterized protein n=1 Tax=Lupinus luteus TaxID=3873 RepID=A0AAV1XW72_LUPLU
MDFWVVAAATGVGYLVKYLNKISKNSHSSYHLFSEDSNIKNPDSPSSKFGKEVVPLDRRDADVNSSFRNCNESDILCVSKLHVSFSANENFNDSEEGNERSSNVSGNCAFVLPVMSAGEVVSIHNAARNKKYPGTKHLYGHISRPLNSLQSCQMTHLCEERAKMEEHVFSPHSSPSRATRPCLVSDGCQVISRENDNDSSGALAASAEYKLYAGASQVKDGNVLFGIPSLPKFRCFDDSRMKFNTSNVQSGRLNSSKDVFKHLGAQHDATFIFSLGIIFGIIACILANKREMDKLRELLKHNENLVQDLQEDLQMKDSMTVEELHGEIYSSQETHDHFFFDKNLNGLSPEKHVDNSPEKHVDNSPVIDGKRSYNQEKEESSESMSKIEAELEAEFERLGLNMNESSLDRRLSELVEFDPDFVVDFSQGELLTDKVHGDDIFESNEDTSDTTNLPVNSAVSPRELSLRLHEVMQSRLEARVEELETALQNSLWKLRFMELEHETRSQKQSPGGEQASSCTKGNILTNDDCDPMIEPLVTNLSGEALGAHNETYEELVKIDNSDESSPSGIYDPDQKVDSHSNDWLQHGGVDGSRTHPVVNGFKLSRELSSIDAPMLEVQGSDVNELNDGSVDVNCDHELEMQINNANC